MGLNKEPANKAEAFAAFECYKPEEDRFHLVSHCSANDYRDNQGSWSDEKERKIILYYDEMLKQQNCYDIELKKVMKIKEIKPAIATIYDYYNPKNTFSTNYNI